MIKSKVCVSSVFKARKYIWAFKKKWQDQKSFNPFDAEGILNQIVLAAKVNGFPLLFAQPVFSLAAAVGSYCPHINNSLSWSFAANIFARRPAEERRWAAIGITRFYPKPRFTEYLIHCDQTGCRKDNVRQSRWKTFWHSYNRRRGNEDGNRM